MNWGIFQPMFDREHQMLQNLHDQLHALPPHQMLRNSSFATLPCPILHIFCIQIVSKALMSYSPPPRAFNCNLDCSDLLKSPISQGHCGVTAMSCSFFNQCSDGKPLRGKQDRTKGGSIYSICFFEFQFMLATYITK